MNLLLSICFRSSCSHVAVRVRPCLFRGDTFWTRSKFPTAGFPTHLRQCGIPTGRRSRIGIWTDLLPVLPGRYPASAGKGGPRAVDGLLAISMACCRSRRGGALRCSFCVKPRIVGRLAGPREIQCNADRGRIADLAAHPFEHRNNVETRKLNGGYVAGAIWLNVSTMVGMRSLCSVASWSGQPAWNLAGWAMRSASAMPSPISLAGRSTKWSASAGDRPPTTCRVCGPHRPDSLRRGWPRRPSSHRCDPSAFPQAEWLAVVAAAPPRSDHP